MGQALGRSIISSFLFGSLLVVASFLWAPIAAQEQNSVGSSIQTEGHANAEETRPPMRDLKCPSSDLSTCITPDQIKKLQKSLNQMGFDAGSADGILGQRTLKALNDFRASKGGRERGLPQHSEVLQVTRYAHSVKKYQSETARPLRGIIGGIMGGDITGQGGKVIGAAKRNASRKTNSTSTVEAAASDPFVAGVIPDSMVPASNSAGAPIPTRVFAGPDQFPPDQFRGYGFFAFPATASDFDFERHMIFCQAYLNSLPTSSSVSQPPIDQFVTVWPLRDRGPAEFLNRRMHRSQTVPACKIAIDSYDDARAREILRNIREAENIALDGLGPYLFGWIPADEFGQMGKLILMLDLSRVSTYEQALIQLQSWQQKIATNPDLLRDGLSIENMRRLVRDWSDQYGQAFLVLIGAG
jgi:peptidoglycan hydrolase-like protein with peptidoglycan-binding domain